MAENLRSKHAFGSEANVDSALASGKIDAYDILFLNEGKIGWIDGNGEKVIIENKLQVVSVDTLPEVGEEGILYVENSIGYTWNGEEFKPIGGSTIVNEEVVDDKIEAANTATLDEAKNYIDEQLANVSSNVVVEF